MLIVDAGPVFAAANRRDRNHNECLALLESAAGPLLVPQLVITEVAYLLGKSLGAEAEISFGKELRAGALMVEPVLPSDWQRIVELAEQYADLSLGLVNASIVAVAERLGVTTIATLDRKHFSAIRPRHTEAFNLLP